MLGPAAWMALPDPRNRPVPIDELDVAVAQIAVEVHFVVLLGMW